MEGYLTLDNKHAMQCTDDVHVQLQNCTLETYST